MNTEIFTETYTKTETAQALESVAFADFSRNLSRDSLSVLPREAQRGRSEGAYKYAHIIEYALHLDLGSTFSRAIAKGVVWGLFKNIFNAAMDADNAQFIKNVRASENQFQSENEGNWSGVNYLTPLVGTPELFFNEERISRYKHLPSIAVFLPRRSEGRAAEVGILDTRKENLKASELLEIVHGMAVRNTENFRVAHTLAADAIVPGVLNLTSAINRVEQNLQHILSTRSTRRGASSQ